MWAAMNRRSAQTELPHRVAGAGHQALMHARRRRSASISSCLIAGPARQARPRVHLAHKGAHSSQRRFG